jgi:two-component system, NtrC family, response regulator AtoC
MPGAQMDNNLLTDLPPQQVIFGKSSLMLDLETKVRRVLSTNVPVLLQGESGTGKSILARFIHSRSISITGSYFSVNCASNSGTLLEFLSSTLVEAEANPKSAEAEGKSNGNTSPQPDSSSIGTLFLKEVAELSPKSQLQLLHRLLEHEGFGDNDQSNPLARARIISATARNLRQEVQENKFRRDLFYRLAVVTLEVPPLRNRRDDLLIIANHLRQRYSESFGLTERPFPDKLIDGMHLYEWPGNIRELENFVCRYVVLGTEEHAIYELSKSNQPVATSTTAPGNTLLREVSKRTSASVEREMIVKALDLHQGSLKHAARTLGISYRTLMNKMDQAGLPRVRHTTRSHQDLKS